MNLQNYALETATVLEKDMHFANIGEALGYSLPKALFGFAVVFGVLILIWGCLALFKVFFYTIPNSRKNSGNKKPTPVVEQTAEVPQTVPVQVAKVSDNNAIVAAIIAAITAFRAQSGEGNGAFRVVSFKKRK